MTRTIKEFLEQGGRVFKNGIEVTPEDSVNLDWLSLIDGGVYITPEEVKEYSEPEHALAARLIYKKDQNGKKVKNTELNPLTKEMVLPHWFQALPKNMVFGLITKLQDNFPNYSPV